MKFCKKGLHSYSITKKRCPECLSIWHKESYKKNPKKKLERNKKWKEANLEKKKALDKAYRLKNKEKIDNYNKQYYASHREEMNASSKQWRDDNKLRCKELMKKWYAENNNRWKNHVKEYGKANRGKTNALSKKYKTQKCNATPKWLTKEQFQEIEKIYIEAARLTKISGVQMHVDHIVPLNGKNVSGLHVPWNLQILSASDNLKKRNKMEIK